MKIGLRAKIFRLAFRILYKKYKRAVIGAAEEIVAEQERFNEMHEIAHRLSEEKK